MTDDVKGTDDDLVAEMLRNYEATRAELTARGVALPDAAVDEEERHSIAATIGVGWAA